MTPEMHKIKPIFMPRIWLTKQKVSFLVRKYGGSIYEYMDVREHVAIIENLKEREKELVKKTLDEVHMQAIAMYESDIDTDSSDLIFVELILDRAKEALSKTKGENETSNRR